MYFFLVYLRFPFVIQAKAFGKSFKKMKCVSITIVSSNMRLLGQFEISLFKNLTSTKKHKTLTSKQKQKMLLKNF